MRFSYLFLILVVRRSIHIDDGKAVSKVRQHTLLVIIYMVECFCQQVAQVLAVLRYVVEVDDVR